MKTFGVSDNKNLASLKCCGRTDRGTGNMSKFNTHQKREKREKSETIAQNRRSNLHCVNNH